MNAITDHIVTGADGQPVDLSAYAGKVLLIVNTASKCGFTPQYAGLEALQRRFADKGFAVLGFPCNQFGAQEPGDAEEIRNFCSLTYDVTFPMFAKVDVNGETAVPLYETLRSVPDSAGVAGDVQWNFEKFLVAPSGEVVGRYRPQVEPESAELIAAIEAVLPG